ncbi:MAG: hypothetical protein NTZ98_24865, partial [Acidobacteria bacterium]|nr:hypothetical protein [Acidobacteriota bacterium]
SFQSAHSHQRTPASPGLARQRNGGHGGGAHRAGAGACRPESGKRGRRRYNTARNSPIAARAVLALVHNVGGTGIEPLRGGDIR